MLLEEVFYHSIFLPWMLSFNSMTTLSPLDVTTSCLLQSLVHPIKHRSIECISKVLPERYEIFIFLSIVGAHSA